jgi:type IV pilus assembly protein PilQ
MLLFNKMKSHHSIPLAITRSIIAVMMLYSFAFSAWSSDLIGIKYNTLQNDEIELQFELTKEIVNPPEMKTVMNPAQIKITFDADNFNENLLKTSVEHAGVSHISVQRLAGKVVATVHLDQLSVFDIQQKGNLFSLILNKAIGDSPVTRVNPLGNNFINNIDSIDFRKGDNDEAQILVYLDDSMVAVDVADKLGKLYIEFHNTQIIDDLLYKLDVTDFGTLVTGIETFKEGRNAKLIVDINSDFTFKHQQLNNVFSLVVVKNDKAPGYLEEDADFSGRAISLNFQDISVRTVLQIIADYNGFNLVTSDSVSGNVTLRLDGVPWDQALDIILKVKGLDKRMEGNILMVAPSDELSAREARDLQAKQQVAELAPLYSEYVQVNYAKATDFANLIKNDENSILSTRGSVSVDERTNTLLIRDTAKSIEDIKRMVNVLDIPVRQVIIEARMVTVKDSINEELGIRWGGLLILTVNMPVLAR